MAIKIGGSKSGSSSNRVESAGGGSWEDAPSEITDRGAIVAVYGDTGTGRTRFALTAPGPIAFAHAGEKVTGVLQEAVRNKGKGQIKVLNFGASLSGSAQAISDQAQPIWQNVRAGLMSAMVDPGWAATGIVDTHNELWELLRLAEFGELNPKGRTDALYGRVNALWRALFKWHRAQPEPRTKSLIVIGQTKDEYKDNKKGISEKTGRTISVGQKEVHYMADVVLRTSRDLAGDYDPSGKGNPGGFLITIEKGWYNAALEGTVLANEDVNYATVMGLITETDPSEWM